MAAAPAGWRRRIGWRGTALLCCGLPWIAYGIGLWTTPREGLLRAATVIASVMPLHYWGLGWALCGAIACTAAVLRPGRDTWGFAAAAAPPLIWCLAYLAAAATGAYAEAWASVPLLATPVLLLLVVAIVTGRRRPRCDGCERGRHGG